MRRNIFEQMSNYNRSRQIQRLIVLFEQSKIVAKRGYVGADTYALKEFVANFCFTDWKSRMDCIHVRDFLETAEYEILCSTSETELDDFFALIEIIGNFWIRLKIFEKNQNDSSFVFDSEKINQSKENVDTNLSHFNHKGIYDSEKEQYLVIEDKPEAIEVVSIVETEELAMAILKYNHYGLKDDVKQKRAVLNVIAQSIDSDIAKKEFKAVEPTLTKNVFFGLNNLHIRHDNITPDSKDYKQHVANMSDNEFIEAYDDLYQMILLLHLKKEHVERNNRFGALKKSIVDS